MSSIEEEETRKEAIAIEEEEKMKEATAMSSIDEKEQAENLGSSQNVSGAEKGISSDTTLKLLKNFEDILLETFPYNQEKRGRILDIMTHLDEEEFKTQSQNTSEVYKELKGNDRLIKAFNLIVPKGIGFKVNKPTMDETRQSAFNQGFAFSMKVKQRLANGHEYARFLQECESFMEIDRYEKGLGTDGWILEKVKPILGAHRVLMIELKTKVNPDNSVRDLFLQGVVSKKPMHEPSTSGAEAE